MAFQSFYDDIEDNISEHVVLFPRLLIASTLDYYLLAIQSVVGLDNIVGIVFQRAVVKVYLQSESNAHTLIEKGINIQGFQCCAKPVPIIQEIHSKNSDADVILEEDFVEECSEHSSVRSAVIGTPVASSAKHQPKKLSASLERVHLNEAQPVNSNTQNSRKRNSVYYFRKRKVRRGRCCTPIQNKDSENMHHSSDSELEVQTAPMVTTLDGEISMEQINESTPKEGSASKFTFDASSQTKIILTNSEKIESYLKYVESQPNVIESTLSFLPNQEAETLQQFVAELREYEKNLQSASEKMFIMKLIEILSKRNS